MQTSRESHRQVKGTHLKAAAVRVAVGVVLLITISVSVRSAIAQTGSGADERSQRLTQLQEQPSQLRPSLPVPQPTRVRRSGIPRTPSEIVDALGYSFVVPFLIASVVAVWYCIERTVVLRRRRVIPKAFVDRFLSQLLSGQMQPQQALQICERNGSPVAQIFAHGIRKWGKPSVEVEQAIIDGGERQVSQLKKNLRVLNGVATVCPLIGLLGTVIGMIQAFNEIANADAMGRANELAVGIALALLTTAVGLLIAIPSLIMYMYLSGRVDALVIDMDDLSQNVVHAISAEGLRSSQAASTQTKRGPKAGKREAVTR